jgi:hypothetical protein
MRVVIYPLIFTEPNSTRPPILLRTTDPAVMIRRVQHLRPPPSAQFKKYAMEFQDDMLPRRIGR